jgi:hypothetical protein
LRHRALRLRRDLLTSSDLIGLRRLADDIRKLLPGSEEPLAADQSALRAEYARAPREIYAGAAAQQRQLMHRIFWTDVVRQTLELESRQRGADLEKLAEQARQQLPDLPDLVEDLRRRGVNEELADLASLHRTRLVAARGTLAELGEPDRAAQVTREWLELQEQRASSDDAEALLRIAADWRAWLGDDEAARRNFLRILQRQPDHRGAQAGMRELGYELVGSQWRSPDEMTPEALRAAQASDAAIQVGDQAADVVRKLQQPSRITRIGAQGRVIEQWIYDGPPPLYVYFRRPTSGPAQVVRVASP